MAKNRKPAELVSEMLKDFLPQHELELYHCDFKKEGKDWYLNVFIDKTRDPETGGERYISTDECELVSRFLSDRLDEDDPIEQNYYLSVSSPGLDRQLYEQKDYDRFEGHTVEIKLYSPVEKKKEWSGTLLGLKDGFIVIKTDKDSEMSFPIDQVVKTNLAIEF